MNATTLSPSRLLKITAVTARWLLGLLVAAWLLFALSVIVLHAWIVPRIGEYRSALQAQASRVVGVPVRIGAITAQSSGLFPAFELRDVVLLDGQQREALRLARLVVSVSPRSLWRLSFEQLYIERPEVDVRIDAAGKLHVAGLDVATDTSGGTLGADWFFSQRELVIEHGTVRWIDERRDAPALLLTDVRFIARNSARRHALRLDATPPAGWGERFSVRGQFRQPLLSVRSGNWQSWDGQMYAQLPRIDISQLGRYVTLDASVRQGDGALRLWADVKDGKLSGGSADLGLARIDVVLGARIEPLLLHAVTGRLAAQWVGDTFQFSTRNLQFDTADGVRWPGGNLVFESTPAKGARPERGALRADRLDLAVLALIANRLPLGEVTHQALATYAPRGLVEGLNGSWQGPLDQPRSYRVQGRVSGLALAAQPAAAVSAAVSAAGVAAMPSRTVASAPPVGRPGVRGASVDFDANQAGGSALLTLAQGALDLPGIFEEPVLPIDQLSAQLRWTLEGAKAQLQVSDLRFANADAQGQAQASWRTSDPATSSSRGRFPGVLDLQGKLTRADGSRVFRYLPLEIPKPTRQYVRDSVTQGSASSVDFRVRGDLNDMPFRDPRQGEFRIAAQVAGVTYAYVPPEHPVPGGAGAAPHWPALTGLAGELVFERAGMRVRNARGGVAGAPGLQIAKASAEMVDMSHHGAPLTVDAQAKGPLGEVLKLAAPLLGPASQAVSQASAAGNADYRLHLELPIEDLNKVKVQAAVTFAGNDLHLAPDLPPLTQLRGTLSFTESGFSLAGGQARLVGGEARIEGSGRYVGGQPDLSFRVQGSATAQGLQGLPGVDGLARLAQQASGSASYSAALSLRGGVPEFLLTSSLQGLALRLPAPLAKSAEDTMPLRFEKKLLRQAGSGSGATTPRDEISASLGREASAHYVRDLSGSEPRVLRGSIAIGLAPGESAPTPERGVGANINLANFDIDTWQSLLAGAMGSNGAPAGSTPADAASGMSPYLPHVLAVQAKVLRLAGRRLHNVVLGGTHDDALWRFNVDADELNGYVEYRQSQAGRLYARLARLKIAPSEANEVASLLDEQPTTLPALDIVVNDFELLGKRLGRAEIDAVNRGGAQREWRLNTLKFTMPEASFSAEGSWAALAGSGPADGRAVQRRTAMNFKLDIKDAGALLARLGMKDVVRRGHGQLDGELAWRGSPFSLDYPSLNGLLHVDVASGQFLKAEPGLAKLLGVLSLQALPRRLTLDFRDLFSQGFAFDFVRGDAKISDGVATTNNLQMKGVSGAALLDGSADIVHETQNMHVVVVPEINAGTAALVATAINPVIGLGAFLAQAILSKPLIAAATQEFDIDGSWTDPKITKVPRHGAPALPDASAVNDGPHEKKVTP